MDKLFVFFLASAAVYNVCHGQFNFPNPCEVKAAQTSDPTMRCVTANSCPPGDVPTSDSCIQSTKVCCKREAEPGCGVERGVVRRKRAVGAAQDVEYANPWTIRIDKDGLTTCTGILINNQFVLTDAHCGFKVKDGITAGDTVVAIVGDYDKDINDYFQANKTIDDVTIHPTWTAYTTFTHFDSADSESRLSDNIAILRLAVPVEFFSQSVNVPCDPRGAAGRTCGETCKVASFGWRRDISGTGLPHDTYRQVLNVKFISNEVCQYHRQTPVPANANCAFAIPDDSGICQADEGSGLVCLDSDTGTWSLEGILAVRAADNPHGGFFCSNQIFVYNDVSQYWSWISDVITP